MHGGVRGLGVRGLGLKQKEQRLDTEARILSFLRVSPFTYEQLQKISKIHRNSLKQRLDQLSMKGIIMKHRYSIPYELKYYGFMYRYPVKYQSPLFGRFYYLLDLSKAEQIQELVSYFLIRSEKEWEQNQLTGKIEIQNLPSFSLAPSVLSSSIQLSSHRNSSRRHISPSELIENRKKSAEMVINTFRWLRERDLSAVKNRVSLPGYPFREKDNEALGKIISFFTNRGFSLQDILVRCSTEHTMIEGERYYMDGTIDTLSLPMTHYSVLWDAVECSYRLLPMKSSQGM